MRILSFINKNKAAASALMLLMSCVQQKTLTGLDASSIVPPPDTISIRIKNYNPQAGSKFNNVFVSNFSVGIQNNSLIYSTARDGMGDANKLLLQNSYGFSKDLPESAVMGFSDLMLYISGITLTSQGSLNCAQSLSESSTNDIIKYNDERLTGSPLIYLGLRDCDKTYFGLDPKTYDFNSNGIPDYLELRCGLNPLDKNEAFISSTEDGMLNIDKCKRHLPIDQSANTPSNLLYSYSYKNMSNADGSTDFLVSNIPVLNKGDQNFIAIYITENSLPTGNGSSSSPGIYTAYIRLTKGYVGRVLEFDYWATTPANYFSYELTPPALPPGL